MQRIQPNSAPAITPTVRTPENSPMDIIAQQVKQGRHERRKKHDQEPLKKDFENYYFHSLFL